MKTKDLKSFVFIDFRNIREGVFDTGGPIRATLRLSLALRRHRRNSKTAKHRASPKKMKRRAAPSRVHAALHLRQLSDFSLFLTFPSYLLAGLRQAILGIELP